MLNPTHSPPPRRANDAYAHNQASAHHGPKGMLADRGDVEMENLDVGVEVDKLKNSVNNQRRWRVAQTTYSDLLDLALCDTHARLYPTLHTIPMRVTLEITCGKLTLQFLIFACFVPIAPSFQAAGASQDFATNMLRATPYNRGATPASLGPRVATAALTVICRALPRRTGDSNTKFFHAIANNRRRSNEIGTIVDDGKSFTKEEDKRQYFWCKFKELYAPKSHAPSSVGTGADFSNQTGY
uniref:Uncharacterized protein n=1 Tax=Ananas comosus var. bracteatus TaxID=296719 RepID=A0A6V7NWL2_ANACO|nr:unnamed protein product [Ananas comosus var. bracteatus]